MGEIIVVTSGKGGVGKTTVAANLGAALAVSGARVCVADADMGLRNVDIVFGMQNDIVYDFLDVYDGYCDIHDALIKADCPGELYILPAPQSRNTEHIAGQLAEVCASVRSEFDYIIIDCPAGIEQGFKNAVVASDRAIVVTQCFTAAVRDADRAVDSLEKAGIENIHLIINCVRPELIQKGIMLNLDEIVDTLGVRLLGVIPEDMRLLELAAESKTVIGDEKSAAAAAYNNIVRRMKGEAVPVADMTPKKKRFFNKFREKRKNI